MPKPRGGKALALRWAAFLALAVGAMAMLTSGQPKTAEAAVFGGGCVLAALAALVLESTIG